MEEDLYAARLSKPPEVRKASTSKDTENKKITKPLKTQKNIMTTIKNTTIDDDSMIDSPMVEDPPLLTKPFAPKLSSQVIPSVEKKVRATPIPISSKISYCIEEDILNRKADINTKDLITAVPALKRNLVRAIKESNKESRSLSLSFAEDDDVDTTAMYTAFYIDGVKIKAMLDTGSAKTCTVRGKMV